MRMPLFLINFLFLTLLFAGPSKAMKRSFEQHNQTQITEHKSNLVNQYESFNVNQKYNIYSIVEKNSINSLQQVQEYIDFLVENGIRADEIALILDLDGTLTKEDTPSNVPTNLTVHERDSSTAFVKNNVKNGVNVIVSSAWDNLIATVKKLEILELKETLGVYQSVEFE